jgi:hypothetical protein
MRSESGRPVESVDEFIVKLFVVRGKKKTRYRSERQRVFPYENRRLRTYD